MLYPEVIAVIEAQLPSLKTILLYGYLYCFYASPLILLNYEKGKI